MYYFYDKLYEMGLYVKQDQQRTELQERIAADLRMKQKVDIPPRSEPVDPAFLDGSHTTDMGWVKNLIFVIIAILAIVGAYFFVGTIK